MRSNDQIEILVLQFSQGVVAHDARQMDEDCRADPLPRKSSIVCVALSRPSALTLPKTADIRRHKIFLDLRRTCRAHAAFDFVEKIILSLGITTSFLVV